MNTTTEKVANEAIFQMQFNNRDAVRYVQRNARVDERTAQSAVRAVMTFHKS